MPPPALDPSVSFLRLAGFAEGLSCLALFGVGMPLKYAAGMPLAVRITGSVHGALFLLFLAALAVAAWRRRWSAGRVALATAAAVVPFGTFAIDRRLRAWDADPTGVIRDHAEVDAALAEAAALIPHAALAAPAVSAWPIGLHLDHLLRAHAGIAERLDGTVPDDGSIGVSPLGRLLLALGWIPRGRGRTPAWAQPQPVEPAALAEALAEARRRHAALAARLDAVAADRARWAHPVFRGLTRRQWLRFAAIHLRHHLGIARDIARRG